MSVIGLYLLLMKDGLVQAPFGMVVIRALGTGLLAALVTPLVFALARRLDRLVGNVVESKAVDEVELPI